MNTDEERDKWMRQHGLACKPERIFPYLQDETDLGSRFIFKEEEVRKLPKRGPYTVEDPDEV